MNLSSTSGRWCASACVALAALSGSSPGGIDAQSSTPVPTVINNGPGDQWDAHVDGNWVVYSSFDTTGDHVRYFDVGSGADAPVPNNGEFGILADVAGNTVVFTRLPINGAAAIYTFDIGTGALQELDPTLGAERQNPSIGGDTIVWEDWISGSFEIVAYDRLTGTPQRLTFDTAHDTEPQVSADGNVIVWQKCSGALSTCEVWQATRTNLRGWLPLRLAVGYLPDTDGRVVIYESARTSGLGTGDPTDIWWQRVGGSAEQQIASPGVQRDPAISDGFAVFMDAVSSGANADLVLYDLLTGDRRQLTATPTLHEILPDISLTTTGVARVAYSVLENDLNVYVVSVPLTRFYTNKQLFLQDAGRLSSVNFDLDPCGAPINAATPVPAGSYYASLGLSLHGWIYRAGKFVPTPPNILSVPFGLPSPSPNPAPPIAAGSFDSAVRAVGLTNLGGAVVLDLFGTTITASVASVRGDNDLRTRDFIGIITARPALHFRLQDPSGLPPAADDLLFTEIRQPSCGG